MKIKQLFYGIVRAGKLILENRKGFMDHIGQFEGMRVALDLDQFKDTRSERQNKYYWGVVIPIFADFFGMDPVEAHEALKWEHLRKSIKDREGNPRITIRSTASMKTNEFEDYMAKLRKWGAEQFSLNIPEPNEVSAQAVDNVTRKW